MSCVNYESAEFDDYGSQGEGGASNPQPFLVLGGRGRSEDQVARRVAEVFDFELAQGSMPA